MLGFRSFLCRRSRERYLAFRPFFDVNKVKQGRFRRGETCSDRDGVSGGLRRCFLVIGSSKVDDELARHVAIGGIIRGHLALCFCFGVAHGITGNPRRREAYGSGNSICQMG